VQIVPVVTISGTYGSGAREAGNLVGDRLGIDYVDRQLLVDAAHRLGVPVEAMAQRDERAATFGQRLALMLRNFLERSAAAGGDPSMGGAGLEVLLSRSYAEVAALREGKEPSDALYLQTVTVVIRELAERGNIVIIGRGSQMILAAHPGALHVLCTAPEKLRIERFALREGLSLEEACRQVQDGDKGRAAFHRKFWKVDVNDPGPYDLVVDTSTISYEVTAELVAMAAQAKAAAAP
jgi:cytidylate kinase